MKDFILELYSEEIPAKMQKTIEADFYKIFEGFLNDFAIGYNDLIVDISPCRISIAATIQDIMPAKEIEIRGPKIDAPSAAIGGFCKSHNLSQDQLVIKEIKDQKFYYIIKRDAECHTKDIIIKYLPEYLNKITWLKSMKWGSYDLEWVRPLKNILCLLGNEIVALQFAHLTANNITFGHKFMHHEKIKIKNKDDYFAKIVLAKVIVSRRTREKLIIDSLRKLCDKLEISLNFDHKLFEEVTGLAEFPVVIHGKISKKFMQLPPEVLITSMRNHQKYFTANNKDGKLAPYFIFVTNLDLENYDEIIAGNERVLSARLSDALYFYKVDKEAKLEDNLERLKNVVFHAKLGSLYDKTTRIEKLSKIIDPDNKNAQKAARLAKCDLVSEMVGEFPELQGIMGSYYAHEQGLNEEICDAIKNHYKPMSTDDEVSIEGAAIVALADKMDSFVGLYLAGERSTGSKDPYALRRYALAIIRIILDNDFNFHIGEFVDEVAKIIIESNKNEKLIYSEKECKEIVSFIEERFKYLLKSEFPIHVINGCIDLNRLPFIYISKLIIFAFEEFKQIEGAKNCISDYKRAKNILNKEIFNGKIVTNLFLTKSELILFEKVETVSSNIDIYTKDYDFLNVMKSLLEFREPLAKFFDENLVNTDDPLVTKNRKTLLYKVTQVFKKVANFDEVE